MAKGRQFRILNDEECSVNTVRLRIEQVIDVEDFLLGSLAFLNPDESTPHDGIFISGHTVKCNERGSTGGPDALKNVGYGQRISSRGQARYQGADTRSNPTLPHARVCADRFPIPRSQVLEGCDQCVVIVVGQMTPNGHVMISS